MTHSTNDDTPVLVVGSGRSGTTWLSDEISQRVHTRPIFEPLHCKRVAGVPAWGMRSGLPGKYVRDDADDKEMLSFFESLFNGQISNRWTQQDWRRVPRWARGTRWPERILSHMSAMQSRSMIANAPFLVIKMIKANLLLGWLDRHFDTRIIFVVRHPCQVVGSRISHGWQSELVDVLSQSQLIADHLGPFRDLMETAETPVQQFAVLWCVENLLPLAQLDGKQWLTMTYEQCLSQPEEAFARIDQTLGIAIQEPPKPKAIDASRKWHDPLTRAEGEEVLRYCEAFGIRLYGRDTRPLTGIHGALDVVKFPA